MPHKHVRRKGNDDANFDLAPSIIAKPLPTYSNASRTKSRQNNVKKQKIGHDTNGYKHDDTPRAFARLMQLQSSKKRQRSGLDDGNVGHSSKKSRRRTGPTQEDDGRVVESEAIAQPEVPKILPGERLADFAARVDQALPVGGLKRKGKVKIEGLKERQTNKEKKMHKMYAAWREEDARRKEKLEEQKELEEDAEAEMDGYGDAFASSGRKNKAAGSDDDPWAELKAKRAARAGLNDVVQAPPSFKAVPKEKFKVKHGAKVDVENVPAAAGSLKKREELGQARREVIERYRAMSKATG